MSRRIVILTEGHTEPHAGKTAASVIRYRADEVVALLDRTQQGKRSGELLGVGDVPIVGQLSEAPSADTLLLGIAPPGGQIPSDWKPIILAAIERGMHVVSGLHDFLNSYPEFVAAAQRSGVQLTDVRHSGFRGIARRQGIRGDCLRILTVGHDCSVGKMVTAIELTNGLRQRGVDAQFVATGQTGIMVSGSGLPLDCLVADFVSGGAEQLVLDQQHHDVLLIEGQGSLVHPSYSGVTLGLLHGCLPQALVLCFEVGRKRVTGVEQVQIPPLAAVRALNDTMASVHQECRTIGVSMNSRCVSPEQAERERQAVEQQLQLPVCDVFRDGPQRLLDAVEAFRNAGGWRQATAAASEAQ